MLALFKNNRTAVLTADLAYSATVLPISSLSTNIFDFYEYGRKIYATLETPAQRENILITGINTGFTGYIIQRGREDTLPLDWLAGAAIGLRLTAESCNHFAQNDDDYVDVITALRPRLQDAMYAAVRNVSTLSPSQGGISDGDVFITSGGGYALLALVGGDITTVPVPTSNGSILKSGTCVFLAIAIDSVGAVAFKGSSYGSRAMSSNYDSLAIGSAATINGGGDHNAAIAAAQQGIALRDGKSVANRAIAIGGFASGIESVSVGDAVAAIQNSLATRAIPAKEAYLVPGQGGILRSNLEGFIWSNPVDLAGGTTWAANTAYKQGAVVKPTTPNGNQYIRIDPKYNKYSSMFSYTGALSGATQPTWGTAEFSETFDGDGSWLAVPNVGMTITLPADYLVTEIGVVVFDAVAVTTQPEIAVGTLSNSTYFVPSVTSVGLAANGKSYVFPITNRGVTNGFSIAINVPATATKLLCQFYFKGAYCPRWY